MDNTAVVKVMRKVFALGLYRWILNTALLVALFHAFPDHAVVSMLAVLAFGHGIAAAILAGNLMHTIQNSLDDAAERKTRQAILLAGDPDWRGNDLFWHEVDSRVRDETPVTETPRWWGHLGMGALSFTGLVASDLVSVVSASVLTALTA